MERESSERLFDEVGVAVIDTMSLHEETALLVMRADTLGAHRGIFRDLRERPGEFSVPIEVRETAEEYLVRVEVPGIRRGRLEVVCDERTLYISGARMDDEEGFARYSERSYGAFSREITLPGAIDSRGARVWYTDGVLEIRLPKATRRLPHPAR
jgi:HSP20 family molecular chaperone IbpA